MQSAFHSPAGAASGASGDDEDDSWAAFESAESTPFASPSSEVLSRGDLSTFSSPPSSGFFSASASLDVGDGAQEDQDGSPEFDSGSALPSQMDESFGDPATAGGPIAEHTITGGASTSANDAALFGFVGSTTENEVDYKEDGPFKATPHEEHKQEDDKDPSLSELAAPPEDAGFASAPVIDDTFVSGPQMELPQTDMLAADESSTGSTSETPFMEPNDDQPSTTNIGFEAVETGTVTESGPIAHDTFSFDEEGSSGEQDGDTGCKNDNNIYNKDDTEDGGINADGANRSTDVGADGNVDDNDDDDDDEFGDFDFAEPVATTEVATTTMSAADGNNNIHNNVQGDGDDMDEFGEMESNNHVQAPIQSEAQAGVSQMTPAQPKKVVWEMSKEEYMLYINGVLSSSFSNHVSLDSSSGNDFEPLLAAGSVGNDDSVSIPSAGAEDVHSRIIDNFVTPILKEHPRLYEDLFDDPEPNEMNFDDDESFRAVNQAGNLSNDHFAHFRSDEVHHGAPDGLSDTLSFTGQGGAGTAEIPLPLHEMSTVSTGVDTSFSLAQFDMRESSQGLGQTTVGAGGIPTPPGGSEYDFAGFTLQQQLQPQSCLQPQSWPEEYHGPKEGRMSSNQPDTSGGLVGSGWDMFANMNFVQSSESVSQDALDVTPHESWHEKEQQMESEGSIRSDQPAEAREDAGPADSIRSDAVGAASFSPPPTMATDLFANMEVLSTPPLATAGTADAGPHIYDSAAAATTSNYTEVDRTERTTKPVSEQRYGLETSSQRALEIQGGSSSSGTVAEDGRAVEESTAAPEMPHHDGSELQQHRQKEEHALEENNMFASMEIIGMSYPGESTSTPPPSAAETSPPPLAVRKEEVSAVEALASVPVAEVAASKATDDWSEWDFPKQNTLDLSGSANPVQSFASADHDAPVDSSAQKKDGQKHDLQVKPSIAGHGASPPSLETNLFADMEIVSASTPAPTESAMAVTAGAAVAAAPFEFGGFARADTSQEPSFQLPDQAGNERDVRSSSIQVSSKDLTRESEFKGEESVPQAVSTVGLNNSSDFETHEWGAFGQAEELGAASAYNEAGSGELGAMPAPSLENQNSSSNGGWSFSPASAQVVAENMSSDGFSSWTSPPNPSVQTADGFGAFSHGGNQSGSGDPSIAGANQVEDDDDFGAFASSDVGGGAASSAATPTVTSSAAAPPLSVEPTPFTWHSVPIPVHLSFMLSDSILKVPGSGVLL